MSGPYAVIEHGEKTRHGKVAKLDALTGIASAGQDPTFVEQQVFLLAREHRLPDPPLGNQPPNDIPGGAFVTPREKLLEDDGGSAEAIAVDMPDNRPVSIRKLFWFHHHTSYGRFR
jgi:hypothetical protein